MSATGSGKTSSKRAVLAIILVSYTLILLDIPVVIAALPKTREGLGFVA
jgi:hypothetical protein